MAKDAFWGSGYWKVVPTQNMSLRDWFAGQVLPQVYTDEDSMTLDEIAHEAYRMSDAMLAEREKQ